MNSYFSVTPEPAGSQFEEIDIVLAREGFSMAFLRIYGEAGYRPLGVFGQKWGDVQYRPGFDHVTYIGLLIRALYRRADPGCLSILDQKIKKLLEQSSNPQFEEDLNEVRTGVMAGAHFPPVVLEPCSGTDQNGRPKPSPDFSVNVEGTRVFIESTTLRVGPLHEWSQAVDALEKRLHEFLMQRGVNRQVTVAAALNYREHSLGSKWKALCDQIASTPAGSLEVHGPDGVIASFEWQEIWLGGSINIDSRAFQWTTRTPLDEVFRPKSVATVTLIPPQEAKAIDMLRSNLENVIRSKKKQAREAHPLLLIATKGFRVYTSEQVVDLVRDIYQPGRYAWLAGVGIATAPTSFQENDQRDSMAMSWNPHCATPIPRALKKAYGPPPGWSPPPGWKPPLGWEP